MHLKLLFLIIFINQKIHYSPSHRRWYVYMEYTIDMISKYIYIHVFSVPLFIYSFIHLSIYLIFICDTKCITTLMPRVARLPQIPYHTTNISAASDGVCVRTKAVYQYFMVWTQELLIFFVLISNGIFIESENKKGWSPCGLN